jgi:hypothetical protein
MSFTNPLWNDLFFEKISEVQIAYMEIAKQMNTINMRLGSLEQRVLNISSALSHMSSLLSTHDANGNKKIVSAPPGIVIIQKVPESVMNTTTSVNTATSANTLIDHDYNETESEGEWTKVSRKRK